MTDIKEFIRDSLDGLSHAIDQATMDGIIPLSKPIIKYACLSDGMIKVQCQFFGKKRGKRVLIGYTEGFFSSDNELPKSFKKVALEKLI